jgi:hypothetical protein
MIEGLFLVRAGGFIVKCNCVHMAHAGDAFGMKRLKGRNHCARVGEIRRGDLA